MSSDLTQNLLQGPQFTEPPPQPSPPSSPKITAGQEAGRGRSRARVSRVDTSPGGGGGQVETLREDHWGQGPQGCAGDQHESGEQGSGRRRRAPGGRPCTRARPRQHTHAVLGAWHRFNVAAPAAPTHPSGQHAAAQKASRSSGAPRRLRCGVPVHTCAEGAWRVLVLPCGVHRRPGRGPGPRRPQRAGAGAGGLGGQRALASSQALLREGVLIGHT